MGDKNLMIVTKKIIDNHYFPDQSEVSALPAGSKSEYVQNTMLQNLIWSEISKVQIQHLSHLYMFLEYVKAGEQNRTLNRLKLIIFTYLHSYLKKRCF